MKRVLITGGTGFVGANLVRRLLSDGHEVWLVVRRGYSNWRLDGIESDIRLLHADLASIGEARRIVAESKPDWIFHLAAHGAYPTQKDVEQIVRTNYLSTVNLVEAALEPGFTAFVNTGSSSEYGFKDHAPAEKEYVEPNSHYAATKAAATQYCRYTGNARQVRMPTLRLYSIYGPWEEPTRLIPNLVVRGLGGEFPPLVSPDIARDYVYVDDACEAFILAASLPGEEFGAVYNVGSGTQTTLGEIVGSARRLLDIDAEPIWGSMPQRSWDTTVWVSDPRRIRRALNWDCKMTLEAGLKAFAEWLRADCSILRYYQEKIGYLPGTRADG